MGERLVVWAFRTGDASQFRRALSESIAAGNGAVSWKTKPKAGQIDVRTLEKSRVCMLCLPYLSGAEHCVAWLTGSRLDIPWLEIRIQEGDHWDYSLFSGREHLRFFSTRASYWGERPHGVVVARRAAARLASEWGMDTNALIRYHRAWDSPPWRRVRIFRRRGYAYEGDAWPYGDIWQVSDFVNTIGGGDVTNVADEAKQHAATRIDSTSLQSAVKAERGESC